MARSDVTSSYGVKVIVHDASVLIDLVTADLLELWFTAGFETVVPSLVWREINRKSQKDKLQPSYDKELLKVAKLPAETFAEVALMRNELKPDISIEDASALFIAIS